MKKKKLKVKKKIWKLIGLVIIICCACFIGKKVYDEKQYQKTNEYKLLQVGYTLDEIKILNEKTTDEKINELINLPKNDFLLLLINEKYYLKRNLNRYLGFKEIHQDYEPKKIVAYVNANRDYELYGFDLDTDTTKDYLLIANKYYHLNSEYKLDDLVTVSTTYSFGSGYQIRGIVYDAFLSMWNKAHEEENIYFMINSGYRSYESQKEIYDDYKNAYGSEYADSIAARPGYSEHQTGLSLDIVSLDATTGGKFKLSDSYKWLEKHAHEYGFIQRYKEDTMDITGFAEESWHWRYVGVDAATYIYENNITFEEYYAYFLEES